MDFIIVTLARGYFCFEKKMPMKVWMRGMVKKNVPCVFAAFPLVLLGTGKF